MYGAERLEPSFLAIQEHTLWGNSQDGIRILQDMDKKNVRRRRVKIKVGKMVEKMTES